MHFLRITFFTVCLAALSLTSYAQDDDAPARRRGSRIIDDTTKQLYGPKTSRYFFEKDVFFNRQVYYEIDTFIRNFHRFNYVQRNNNLYQDLGNIGTAIRPIYYQSPEVIGVTPGFQSYDLYWNDEAVKYFDTKSPYANLKVVIGGKGRNMTRVAFSRNINPRWNFGFNFRTLLVDKQFQRLTKGDRQVKSTYYDLYTTYLSKDSTYRLFVNFRRQQHLVNENGGIYGNTDPNNFVSPFDILAQPDLTKAQTQDRRNNFHLFHQYQIFGKGFQVYHSLDSYVQHNRFSDFTSVETRHDFDFKNTDVPSDTVSDQTRFHSLRNEVGLKGNLLKLFYNGYYAIRQYDMQYKYLNQTDLALSDRLKGTEHYLGGRMSLALDSIGEVTGWAELESNGNYRIEGSIKSKWFEASLKEVQYQPSFLLQAYRGAHNDWNSSLRTQNSTQINGYLHYTSRVISVSPGLTFTRLNNYAYFVRDTIPQKISPAQSTGSQVIASPEFNFSLTMLRHITLSAQTIYTSILQNKDNVMSIPKLFVNGQLSYANIFFHGNMDMHAGVDLHWKSTYDAWGYDPIIQQFYRQNDSAFIAKDSTFTNTSSVKAFPIVDIFFNMKVKRGRIFLKYNNLVQAFTKSGYYPTPNYPGQRNSFDFGFDWSFYD